MAVDARVGRWVEIYERYVVQHEELWYNNGYKLRQEYSRSETQKKWFLCYICGQRTQARGVVELHVAHAAPVAFDEWGDDDRTEYLKLCPEPFTGTGEPSITTTILVGINTISMLDWRFATAPPRAAGTTQDPDPEREEALATVERGYSMEAVLPRFRGDKGVVLAAVRQDGANLKYAEESFRRDREVVLAACKQYTGKRRVRRPFWNGDEEYYLSPALECADESFYGDGGIMLETVRTEVEMYGPIYTNFTEGIGGLHRWDHWASAAVLSRISDELLRDRSFMLEVVKLDGCALKYASDELREDNWHWYEIVSAAVKQNIHASLFAGGSLEKECKDWENKLLGWRRRGCRHDGPQRQGIWSRVCGAVDDQTRSLLRNIKDLHVEVARLKALNEVEVLDVTGDAVVECRETPPAKRAREVSPTSGIAAVAHAVSAIKKERDAARQQIRFSVCRDTVSVCFMPCRHLAACARCAPRLDECPICEKPVESCVAVILPP